MKTISVTNKLGQAVEIQWPEIPEELEQRRLEVNLHPAFNDFIADGWLEDE